MGSFSTALRGMLPVLAAALMLVSAGCANLDILRKRSQEPPPATSTQELVVGPASSAEALALQAEAVDKLRGREYDEAARAFSLVLSSPEADLPLQRQALYGRAVARLCGASRPETLDMAMKEWKVWVRQYSAVAGEDLSLMTPVLVKLREQMAQTRRLRQEFAVASEGKEADLRAADENMARLKTELEALSAVNDELRSKISALEDLQQEIDIKRKGIITP